MGLVPLGLVGARLRGHTANKTNTKGTSMRGKHNNMLLDIELEIITREWSHMPRNASLPRTLAFVRLFLLFTANVLLHGRSHTSPNQHVWIINPCFLLN
jgi:hypothetical protein